MYTYKWTISRPPWPLTQKTSFNISVHYEYMAPAEKMSVLFAWSYVIEAMFLETPNHARASRIAVYSDKSRPNVGKWRALLPPSFLPSLELKRAAGSPHLPEHLKAPAPTPVPARLNQSEPDSGHRQRKTPARDEQAASFPPSLHRFPQCKTLNPKS